MVEDTKDVKASAVATELSKSAPAASWLPGRKVLAGGLAGLATFGLLTGLRVWAHIDLQAYADIFVPPPGTMNVTALITGAMTAGVSYFTPPSVKDVISHLNDRIVDLAGKMPDSPVTPRAPTNTTK